MEIRSRGQSIWEYVTVLGLVSLVVIAMQVYFKRGVQGRLKDLADSQISSQQYVSGETKSDAVTTSQGTAQSTLQSNVTGTTTQDTTTRHSTDNTVGEGWQDLLP
ncbi:MAG: hypothetical protein PHJ00_01515 [Candidatus Omnitrophica bacterium]|jgi:Flp pilus assembly pilin Flp|nr:hypothetical protein [Candidatus Omnitrophota bacterium]MDD5654776.1 hypothetical protein [Candidatus Omnitrophota bacterium]